MRQEQKTYNYQQEPEARTVGEEMHHDKGMGQGNLLVTCLIVMLRREVGIHKMKSTLVCFNFHVNLTSTMKLVMSGDPENTCADLIISLCECIAVISQLCVCLLLFMYCTVF